MDVKSKDTEEVTETVEVTEDAADPDQEIEDELERLNAEAAARAKRERRRANEAKTKTIQRMQLQMTAPLDIGLEQQDLSLGFGQDDIFALEDTERGLRRTGGVEALGDEMDDEESGAEEDAGEEEEDDEILDSDEERERKVAELEGELDGLYDAYQQRLKERDAKYKVREARKNDKSREEWGGIHQKGSDDEDSGEEGGYERVQAAKARADENSDSSDSEDESEVETPTLKTTKKRSRGEEAADFAKKVKKAKVDAPVANSSAQLSRAAQVWFDQDFFKSAGLEDVEDEDEDEDEEMADEHDEDLDVEMVSASGSGSTSESERVTICSVCILL